jgi:hypothetical protein
MPRNAAEEVKRDIAGTHEFHDVRAGEPDDDG